MANGEKEIEYQRLVAAVRSCGFPAEFADLLAGQLRGPWGMRLMTGYLREVKPTSVELVADELISILEQRQALVDKAMTESANAGWNEFLNREDVD